MVWTISLQSLHGNSCRSRTSVLFYCNLCSIVSVGLMLVQCTRYCRSRIVHALYCAPAHTASKSIGSIKTLYYVLQQLFLFRYWWKQTLLSSNIEYTIGVDSIYLSHHQEAPYASPDFVDRLDNLLAAICRFDSLWNSTISKLALAAAGS